MIEVSDLTVRFDRATVVDGVSFTLDQGESLALWGQNGAGKTTVIRAILGLVPARGQIRVGGHAVPAEGRLARAKIGYVPQQLAFYDDLSALALLRYFAGLRGVPAGGAEALLQRVDLAEHAAKPVGALSGGMKQRLALAAALLGNPPILVLDEPTANLDAAGRLDFLALLAGLRAGGKSLLVTSHRLAEVEALADRALVLERGRVTAACHAADLEATLYPHTTLILRLDADRIEDALAVLAGAGFTASVNGRGVKVQVDPGRRAAPVATLVRADIPIVDMVLEDGAWTASS